MDASVKARIDDRQSAADVSTADAQYHRIEHGEEVGWLAPIPLEAKRKKVRERESARRADNEGCLAKKTATVIHVRRSFGVSSSVVVYKQPKSPSPHWRN